MCIAYLAISANPRWPLFIAANRDEFHQRASLPAAPWSERPDVIAGIDCLGKGSWLGITRQGRYALLTNYRDPSRLISDAPSRGELVSQYLTNLESPASYSQRIHDAGPAYNGFNLIVGDLNSACYVGNRAAQTEPQTLQPGRYIVSNHLLDTPWPKAERLRTALDSFALEGLEQSLTPIFEILKDNTPAEDHTLPSTGLTLERERLLSSPFIISPDYGTRCSTVIAVHASGRVFFSEVSYDESGRSTQRHDWPFSLVPRSAP
jgi:uncharacterized protein with NRDE domain